MSVDALRWQTVCPLMHFAGIGCFREGPPYALSGAVEKSPTRIPTRNPIAYPVYACRLDRARRGFLVPDREQRASSVRLH